MKVLVLSLAALTFVSGAFGAGRVHTSSPTNSVKAKKLLEGPEAAEALLLQQNAPAGSKQHEILGAAEDDTGAKKEMQNLKRKLDKADQAAKAAHEAFVNAAKKNKADKEWIKGAEAKSLKEDLQAKNKAFFILDKDYKKFQEDNPLLAAAA